MTKLKPCDLAGLSILVTRPAEQAETLCELIQNLRGRPIRFPALEIKGPENKKEAQQQLALIAKTDLVIFISRNAVQYAFPLLPDNIPLDLQISAVGTATANALEEYGLDPTVVPDKMDSEGLLTSPQLQNVKDKNILIIRGNGGRELLAETLKERGANVEYAEVYRRQLPQRNAKNLVNGWSQMVDTVVATSNAILDNLLTLLGEDGGELLKQTPLVVVSQRMAEHADALGCEIIYISDSATDADVLKTLCEVNEDIA